MARRHFEWLMVVPALAAGLALTMLPSEAQAPYKAARTPDGIAKPSTTRMRASAEP